MNAPLTDEDWRLALARRCVPGFGDQVGKRDALALRSVAEAWRVRGAALKCAQTHL